MSGRPLRASVNATVRTCLPGEVRNQEGNECNPCSDPRQYTFSSSATRCELCPDNANCTDGMYKRPSPNAMSVQPPVGAILVPQPGFWHSSPRSSQIHRCPNPAACDPARLRSLSDSDTEVANSTENLQAVAFQRQLAQGNVTVLSNSSLAAYSDLLCSQGYSGRVCAICLPGHGRKGEGTCVKVWRSGLPCCIHHL